MYAFIGKSDKGALVIVRVENPEKALEVLKDEKCNGCFTGRSLQNVKQLFAK